MKYLVILGLLVVPGCTFKKVDRDNTSERIKAHGVEKFKDGKITCYLYYSHGISCLEVTNEK